MYVFSSRCGLSIWETLSCVVAAFFLGWSPIYAQEKAQNENALPTIVQHTKPAFTIYKGDKIKLKVEALGNNLNFRWVRKDQVVCTGSQCELDTTEWGLGRHFIVQVTYNQKGSKHLKFSVFVLEPTPGFQPRVITPDLVKADEQPEVLRDEDLLVQMVSGPGYSYTKDKLSVVGQNARPLEWDEKIRSTSQGVMVLSQGSREEHFLLPSSLAVLRKSEFDRRIIQLEYGAVRSRILESKSNNFSIASGDQVQIDGDEKLDVIVERTKTESGFKTLVTVLRGVARILSPTISEASDKPPSDESKDFKDAAAELKESYLGAGESIAFDEQGAVSSLLVPNPEVIGSVVRRSTRQYLPQTTSKVTVPSYAKYVLGAARVQSAKQNLDLKRARTAASENDAVVTLEVTMGHMAKAKQDYDVAMIMADAYRDLQLHKEAFAIYRIAHVLRPKEFRPPFEMGVMAAKGRMWSLAKKWLTVANGLTIPKEEVQNLRYLRGVASYWKDNRFDARGDLYLALWNENDASVSESANAFLEKIREKKSWYLNLKGGLLYDQNPLHAGSDTVLSEGYEKKASTGYFGSMDANYRFLRLGKGEVGIGFDASARRYTESTFKEIAWLDERLYFDILGKSGQSEKGSLLEFRLQPYLKLAFIGSERSDDTYGLYFQVRGVGVKAKPQFEWDTTVHQDPLPARDDLLDPVTLDYTAPSERSNRRNVFKLGMSPLNNFPFKADTRIAYELLSYRNQFVRLDSFRTLSLDIDLNYYFSGRSIIMPKFSYGSRSFQLSSDQRKDTLLDLDLSWRWYYLGTWYHDIGFQYFKNTSTRSTNTYSTTVFSLAMGLDL